eukprot:SAG11_NODE_25246_length_361_cov_1.171756_1_plen_85_part_00
MTVRDSITIFGASTDASDMFAAAGLVRVAATTRVAAVRALNALSISAICASIAAPLGKSSPNCFEMMLGRSSPSVCPTAWVAEP